LSALPLSYRLFVVDPITSAWRESNPQPLPLQGYVCSCRWVRQRACCVFLCRRRQPPAVHGPHELRELISTGADGVKAPDGIRTHISVLLARRVYPFVCSRRWVRAENRGRPRSRFLFLFRSRPCRQIQRHVRTSRISVWCWWTFPGPGRICTSAPRGCPRERFLSL